MTKYQKLNVLNVITVLAMIGFAFSLKSSLPESIPTKFDANGVAIAFAPFLHSVVFMPLVVSLVIGLLVYLCKKNPYFWGKENNKEAVAQTNLGIFLLVASMYCGTFLTAANYETFHKFSFFSIGFGLFFVVSATAMKKIDRNMLYGIRLPWTLKSDLNWKKTHEFSAVMMLVAGALLIIVGLVTKNHGLILSLLTLSFLIPSIYSFKLRKLA